MYWHLKERIPKEILEQMPEHSNLILQLLFNRGITDKNTVDRFLNPDYNHHLYDPFLLLNAEKAIKRIKEAVEKKEKIVIWGDYDCDGICSATIMYQTLKDLGIDERNMDVYIPDRNREGYGLNIPQLDEVIKNQTNLLIVVDCGGTDFEEIEYANKFNLDIIVIDHHVLSKKPLPAYAVINPKDPKSEYPFRQLAATGVVFKFVIALLESFDKKFLEEHNIKEGYEKWFLDLVALATLADGMLLHDENRIFVKYGLFVLSKTKRIGLKALMRKNNLIPEVDDFNFKTTITEQDLNFVLIPRLNAMGRMEHAATSFELLNCISEEESMHLVERLEFKNRERQNVSSVIAESIENELKKKPEPPLFILEANKNWLPGVLGQVCGKINDKYNKPVCLFSISNGVATGSCRSVPDLNLAEMIDSMRDLLIDGGGHPAAAGIKLREEHLEELKNKILKYAEEKLKNKDLTPKLEIDLELTANDINFDFYEQIKNLAPFGNGNPLPVFTMKNLEILDLKQVGNGEKHLKLRLRTVDPKTNTVKFFNAIGFNFSASLNLLKTGDKIDIAFSLLENNWSGNRELEFKIIDLKLAK